MPDQPLYVLRQSFARAVLPKAISLVVLGVIFYLGVLLNVTLLELSDENQFIINISTLIFLALLVIIGTIVAVQKAREPCFFYSSFLTLQKQNIPYQNITAAFPKKDVLDKLFHTYALPLGNNLFLRHLPDNIDLQSYLQQLKAYNFSGQK